MIEICNLRKEGLKNEYDVRVDRTSILGNPFYMSGEWERDDVCLKYEIYFKIQLRCKTSSFYKELMRIKTLYNIYGKIRLFCWCYPRRCHALTIKKWLEGKL